MRLFAQRWKKRGSNHGTDGFVRNGKIGRILMPLFGSILFQQLYNIADSFFVGRYSDAGLTALSIIYPIQLLMIAFAVGTGVGINTVMASKLGVGKGK